MEKLTGLTSTKAAELLEKFGRNEIVEKAGHSKFQIFIGQFKSLLVLLLIFASILSLALGEVLDGALILTIVILNGLFGYIQEFKAEQAIAALKQMTVSKTRVLRDGSMTEVDSTLLVPGDIIELGQGDKIPADAVLIHGRHLEVNEAVLTGESIPVSKESSDNDHNQIYLGTIVTSGKGTAKITETGMQTRFGKIADTLSSIKEEETPLEKKIGALGKMLGIIGVGASSALFVIGLLRQHPIAEVFLTSISLAVAAVPEGLPAIITITLAIGTQRMARRKSILRKLSAIETLGSINVIATDKTGTLTRNEMSVDKIWLNGKTLIHVPEKPEHASELLHKLITVATVVNDARLVHKPETSTRNILGDPTEGALLLLAHDYHVDPAEMKTRGEIIEEYDFDATRKTMTTIWKIKRDGWEILTKGAPEILLEKSTHILTDKGPVALTAEKKKSVLAGIDKFSGEGLRCIGFCYRVSNQMVKTRDNAENDFVFIGFVGLSDPPRKEVKEAIAKAKIAGIRTIMITGDNPLTARTIGRAVGLLDEGDEVITGSEFNALSDEQAKRRLKDIQVFARTSPEEKLRIVRLLQENGNVVGVTGDGVNDALALKQANVGVAMGITGTDVAKGTADMIVLDDNYATIVSAIEEGRTIYENMKSTIKYLVSCNMGEVISIIVATLLGWPIILTPIQILFINLVTDGLPAIGLALTPANESIMKRKPHGHGSLFTHQDKRWLLETGLLATVAMLSGFYFGYDKGDLTLGRTLAFTVSIVVQQYVYLDLLGRDNPFYTMFKKTWLPVMAVGSILIQLFVLYTPLTQRIFDVKPLDLTHLALGFTLPAIVIAASLIRKSFFKRTYYTQ